MDKELINISELKNFVEKHSLSNSHSIIHFNANIHLSTAKNEIEENMEVRITFDGYDGQGVVTLNGNDLDPMEYPTQFIAKWQDMKHKDDIYLLITGDHRLNPQIGKYRIKIVPIG